MHICFDNSRRLRRKNYLLEYQGIRFKLVQNNPRKWADLLLTVLPDREVASRERAFAAASEFLSALSWENEARIMLWEYGGRGWKNKLPLGRARPVMFDFPRIPYGGEVRGYDIARIPKVETDEQRIALTLFREAAASNNNYLSFLFYWQVLETGRTKTKPADFVNKTYKRKPRGLRLNQDEVKRLSLNRRSLGRYLRDDCRDAIAHIRRKPGKKKLELNRTEERTRITISVRVVRAFAKYYISDVLNLKGRLYLVRKTNRGFPIFADDEYISKHGCVKAYPVTAGT